MDGHGLSRSTSRQEGSKKYCQALLQVVAETPYWRSDGGKS